MTTKKQPDRVSTVYPAKDGYRWRLEYNGKTLADSGQAYKTQNAARTAARSHGVGADYPVVLRYQKRGVWVEERIR